LCSPPGSRSRERSRVFQLLFPEPVAYEVAQFHYRWVLDRIVRRSALGATDDHSRVKEMSKVFAYVRLAQCEPFDELANVRFSLVHQELQDSQSRGVGQDAEALGDVLQQVRGEARSHIHHFIVLRR
jgi:hypothetical protein